MSARPSVLPLETWFDILGEFDPGRVTQIMGVQPSSARRRGQRVNTAKRMIPVQDLWMLRMNELDVDPLAATRILEQAVARLEPLAERLRHVRNLYPKTELRLTVMAYIEPNRAGATAPILSLSHSLLGRLAKLGVRLALDYMPVAPDEEEDGGPLDGSVRAD